MLQIFLRLLFQPAHAVRNVELGYRWHPFNILVIMYHTSASVHDIVGLIRCDHVTSREELHNDRTASVLPGLHGDSKSSLVETHTSSRVYDGPSLKVD